MSKEINRNQFLYKCSLSTLALTVTPGFLPSLLNSTSIAASNKVSLSDVEAMFYKKLENKKVKCELCPRGCEVADLERGYCGVRENRDGIYHTLVHSHPCTIHIDPIEKKPLFHFYPGSSALSLATTGCNILCKFCQNWEISQARPEQIPNIYMPPNELVKIAKNKKCKSIAFTYTEPVVFYEYVYDTAKLTKNSQVKTIVISNGYIKEKPLRKWCSVLDAIKIDLKAFTEDFYKKMCDGELKPVLETLKILKEEGIWFEIVTLLLPDQNDSPSEIEALANWILNNLGPDVPLHFTRFFPTFQITNLPPTPKSSLERAHKIAKKVGLHYVYIGNIPGHPLENTYCHNCNHLLISRYGFIVRQFNIKDGKCPNCGTPIPGLWS